MTDLAASRWTPSLDSDESEPLRSAVLQALGAASMCWVGGTGDRVFDSAQAAWVGDGLMTWIEEHTSDEGAPSAQHVDTTIDGVIPEAPLTLVQDLAVVLNRHSAENGSDTPDWILADLLTRMLFAFDVATIDRGNFYGHHCSINCHHGDGLA